MPSLINGTIWIKKSSVDAWILIEIETGGRSPLLYHFATIFNFYVIVTFDLVR